MRSVSKFAVLAVVAAILGIALMPSSANAAGPYWGRRPIYINGEYIGNTYTYPTHAQGNYNSQNGTVILPPAYYSAPAPIISGNYYAPTYNNGRILYPSSGYYNNGYYYGR